MQLIYVEDPADDDAVMRAVGRFLSAMLEQPIEVVKLAPNHYIFKDKFGIPLICKR